MALESVGVSVVESENFRESFDSFYQREVTAVVGLAFVLSGSRTGAEDLAQEGFLAAYRQWDRISSFDDPWRLGPPRGFQSFSVGIQTTRCGDESVASYRSTNF